MENNKREVKDPFAEYDKFWDELDKAEEIRDDEDYFKERSIYKDQKYKKPNKNKLNTKINVISNASILFFIFGFVVLFIFLGNFTMGRIMFVLPSFIIFGVFMFIVLSIISKLKNQ
ncbi:hypothetical protein [Mariniplasma anaerobium]|uniref:Uncharacterized protein n=1 Tax=Mariniplasma anaerobium TaxID=2735436 RepID=A0A7U9TGW1_9MOLU|nr:hypothetical protein [Mariniplasma anaerobium]BCR36380.1 hypothetical protein MPAN_012730 [Mariniplasma anaerobium]